jgi:hypothetical protein
MIFLKAVILGQDRPNLQLFRINPAKVHQTPAKPAQSCHIGKD